MVPNMKRIFTLLAVTAFIASLLGYGPNWP